MTPGARLAAAAEILDAVGEGAPVEKALTSWARRSRFAGSKDRAAIRDHVFDVMRQHRSCSLRGGGDDGRRLIIGLLRGQGVDPADMMTGDGYGMAALTEEEAAHEGVLSPGDVLDCPAWLEDDLRAALGDDFEPVLNLLKSRADVFLRVNPTHGTMDEAQAELSRDGIECAPHALADTALIVQDGARRVHLSEAYKSGLVELQDAASQAISALIPMPEEGTLLDYCAGGGGKILALAAREKGARLRWFAHDANPARMKDLPARAARAGASIQLVSTEAVDRAAPFAQIVLDVPCSGSGAWRRQPEAKWRLDRAGLDGLIETQRDILRRAVDLSEGNISYVTCSLLRAENEDQIAWFLAEFPDWRVEVQHRISPLQGGDGFFLANLTRAG